MDTPQSASSAESPRAISALGSGAVALKPQRHLSAHPSHGASQTALARLLRFATVRANVSFGEASSAA